ncbi:UNVERIFIED_CONTAM: hypothetical protein FKN15_022530 [Acipenser sinensis]
MAERCFASFLLMEPTVATAMTLPVEVREKLAELELELSEASLYSGGRRALSRARAAFWALLLQWRRCDREDDGRKRLDFN